MDNSRIRKSARNMTSGIAYRILTVFTAFLVRTVFIRCLGNDYLGVNGLYGSILSMLSLAELGFGTAMVYSMYKPLADKDYPKLTQLMKLYRDVYRIIGAVVLILGLLLIPFLDILIKNKPNVQGLTFYYCLFLFDSVLSYWFFAYRSAILQADQRGSVISNYSSIFNLIKSCLQIVVLLLFHNYTIYLLSQMFCTITQNIFIARRASKDYPIFKDTGDDQLPIEEKSKIFSDVKALMLQKVSFKVLNTSDSLIISAFVGVNMVGLLSNYLLIEEAIKAFLSQVLTSITASMGNYFAKEKREDSYRLFCRLDFMNFWLYTFSSIALVSLLSPFVNLWLGESYLLEEIAVVALVLRFYVEGYMNMMSAFRTTLGLFTQGKYIPLAVAAINIVLSIGLSYPIGIAGVLIATPLSRLLIHAWYTPYIIHRDAFHKSVKPFYCIWLTRLVIFVVILAITLVIRMVIINSVPGLGGFIIMVLLTAFIPNSILYAIYRKSDEFRYFKRMAKSIVRK